MKLTRANVAELVEGKGYDPIQVDGIPEGFSFWAPQDRTMANVRDMGALVAFRPLKDRDSQEAMCMVPIQVPIDASRVFVDRAVLDAKHKLLELFVKN